MLNPNNFWKHLSSNLFLALTLWRGYYDNAALTANTFTAPGADLTRPPHLLWLETIELRWERAFWSGNRTQAATAGSGRVSQSWVTTPEPLAASFLSPAPPSHLPSLSFPPCIPDLCLGAAAPCSLDTAVSCCDVWWCDRHWARHSHSQLLRLFLIPTAPRTSVTTTTHHGHQKWQRY